MMSERLPALRGAQFIEIGTYRGNFMRMAFLGSSFGHWFGVDPFIAFDDWTDDPLADQEKLDEVKREALARYAETSNATLLQRSSEDAKGSQGGLVVVVASSNNLLVQQTPLLPLRKNHHISGTV